METLLYLVKFGAIYSILYIIYFIFFRKNTNFQVNRIYLLLIIPTAFVLPFINTSVEVATQYQVILPTFELTNLNTETTNFSWSTLSVYLYIIISSILLLKLLINLFKTLQTITKIKNGEIKETLSFSFFSFIHVPENIENEERIAILLHEQVHSTQIHSFDILIYELSKILLWWNPFLWMGLNSVKSNHEFIADKLASEKVDKYSSVLVAQLLGVNCSVLANNFNYKPLIKKRIMMMKTKKSNRLSVLKYVLVIPIVALTIVISTNKEVIANSTQPTIEITIDSVYTTADKMPKFKGGTEKLMTYLGNNVKYPEKAKENKIEGIVYVSFVVDNKGGIKKTTILKSVDPLLDAEAKRVIENMPKWKPGKNKGKKVNVQYVIPINFKLKK